MQTKLKHIALAAVLVLNGCATQSDKPTASAPAASTSGAASAPVPAPVSAPAASSSSAPSAAPVAAVSTGAAAPVVAASKPESTVEAPEIKLGVAYTTLFTDGSRLKETPEEVLIVRPQNTQNTVAAQVALNMFMFALGGGMAVNTFGKEELKGDKFEDVKDRSHVRNPVATDFTAQLSRAVNAALQSRPELKAGAFKNSVMVAGGSSKLIYEALTGDDANMYKMSTSLSVYKRKESAGMFTFNPFVEVSCNRVSEQALSLEEWAKDDYVRVEQWVTETLDQCSKKVVGALPELLES